MHATVLKYVRLVVWHATVQYSAASYGLVEYDIAWYGTDWHSLVESSNNRVECPEAGRGFNTSIPYHTFIEYDMVSRGGTGLRGE